MKCFVLYRVPIYTINKWNVLYYVKYAYYIYIPYSVNSVYCLWIYYICILCVLYMYTMCTIHIQCAVYVPVCTVYYVYCMYLCVQCTMNVPVCTLNYVCTCVYSPPILKSTDAFSKATVLWELGTPVKLSYLKYTKIFKSFLKVEIALSSVYTVNGDCNVECVYWKLWLQWSVYTESCDCNEVCILKEASAMKCV